MENFNRRNAFKCSNMIRAHFLKCGCLIVLDLYTIIALEFLIYELSRFCGSSYLGTDLIKNYYKE